MKHKAGEPAVHDKADRGKGRTPLSGGHWVTIHETDGGYRHLYIKGGKVAAGLGVGHGGVKANARGAHGRTPEHQATRDTFASNLKSARRIGDPGVRKQATTMIRAKGREMTGRGPAKVRAKAGPSVREQAAAHRASKGGREERVKAIVDRHLEIGKPATYSGHKQVDVRLGKSYATDKKYVLRQTTKGGKEYDIRTTGYSGETLKRRDELVMRSPSLADAKIAIRKGAHDSILKRAERIAGKPAAAPAKPTVREQAAAARQAAPGRDTSARRSVAAELKAARKVGDRDVRFERVVKLAPARETLRADAYAARAGDVTPHVRARIDAAFNRLDARNKSSNFVKLSDLRNELHDLPRPTVDKALREMRVSGKYGGDSHEGLTGKLSRRDRTAGIKERGARLVYLSRKDR